jgi:hypothetical protein
MSWIQIDVDLDDVYDSMGSYEKRKMAEWLDEDGYTTITTESEGYNIPPTTSSLENEFHNMLINLSSKFYQMSNEEVEMITKLYKKYE